VDLGANRGAFTRAVEQKYGLRSLLLVEANPSLARELSQVANWNVENCAAASREGSLAFNIAANDEGSSILDLPEQSQLGCSSVGTVSIRAKTLESLLGSLAPGTIDLLKVDIEGAEVEILLESPPHVLQRFGQITVEFHCDPMFGFGGRAQVTRALARMRSLGFECLCFDARLMDVLFVNHRQLELSGLDRLRMRLRPAPPPAITKLWYALPEPVRGAARTLLSRVRGG